MFVIVRCADANKVKLILGGNPEVKVPSGFDMSTLSWIDLSSLDDTEIININADRYSYIPFSVSVCYTIPVVLTHQHIC